MKHIRKILAFSLSIILVFSIIPITASAASGTKYEVETNDYYSQADWTYDDYSNYGTISSTSDVDWWRITFSFTGMANIYLGSIPSGCNYDIEFYAYNATNLVAYSDKSSNSNEFIQCRVISGKTYYVKVSTSSGTSGSYYHLRMKKLYLRRCKVFHL